MTLNIVKSRHGYIITFFGISAIIVLISLTALSFILMNALEPDDMEHRVRMILKRNISQRQMDDLKSAGMKIPDDHMAQQWQKEYTRIMNLEFLSVSTKNPLLDIFSPDQPNFVVRVEIREESNQIRTLYFWLSWTGIDREISKIAWYFSI